MITQIIHGINPERRYVHTSMISLSIRALYTPIYILCDLKAN